jgi:hypothetical protein
VLVAERVLEAKFAPRLAAKPAASRPCADWITCSTGG